MQADKIETQKLKAIGVRDAVATLEEVTLQPSGTIGPCVLKLLV